MRQGIEVPRESGGEFIRYASKMATGSGKTMVMGMISAWSILNKMANRSDARFSDAFIVVGKVQRDMGRLPESRDAYRKYLELAPLGTHAEEARAALATLPP